MVVRADWEWSDSRGEPPDQLELSEWTLPGGPEGEVTEGGLLVSCQLLACKYTKDSIMHEEGVL